MTDINTVRAKYEGFRAMDLSLNMERGQPADDNLDLSLPLLDIVGPGDVITDSGIDVRNYPGGILGLPEAREVFSKQLGIEPDEIMVGNSSSLELMSSFLSWALLKGVKGSSSGWAVDSPKLIVTVPGYVKPKFDAVQETLESNIGNKGLASWTNPKGGYFVSLDTSRPVADRVVDLARQAGVALTPTGATFPGKVDPDNRNIRLAPTRPPLAEVEQAMQVVACCIELATAEYDSAQP